VSDRSNGHVASFELDIESGHAGAIFGSGNIERRPWQTFALAPFVAETLSKSGVRAFVLS
jgi:hypothetical protein